MNATTFDTLAVMRELEAAGVERKQAEAHAEALRKAATADHADLATKADVRVLRSDIRVLQWVIGVQTAVVTVMLAIFVAKLL